MHGQFVTTFGTSSDMPAYEYIISGVESFVQARRRLLTLTPALAALSDDVKALYEDPESSYNIGWSHGKEALSGN